MLEFLLYKSFQSLSMQVPDAYLSLSRCYCHQYGKLDFSELSLETQNAECRMQNKGIFFENDFMN